jgi:hypothetical protein
MGISQMWFTRDGTPLVQDCVVACKLLVRDAMRRADPSVQAALAAFGYGLSALFCVCIQVWLHERLVTAQQAWVAGGVHGGRGICGRADHIGSRGAPRDGDSRGRRTPARPLLVVLGMPLNRVGVCRHRPSPKLIGYALPLLHAGFGAPVFDNAMVWMV